MRKMDEMGRNIRLRSEELGFKSAVLILAVWVLYECWQGFFNGGTYNHLPALILIVTLCVQGLSEMVMKRKMISGDEEYKEPNKILWWSIMFIAAIAIILSIGSYLMLNYN
ncbi:hypothetical protein DFR58_1451 [Anaerobacterium chartisolvens]|uniref:Uncharacterized protein n=1 Tax=Anaerobacterium chartisolvens TaxID=1297424 RepID=A0A369AG62_9FIRM|nr:hypothetical protein [Anaerobacterium chartisolvens]RCX08161.1 hypothetical protein DFR58_1451 [Anaerobacterium chartisolvens]